MGTDVGHLHKGELVVELRGIRSMAIREGGI